MTWGRYSTTQIVHLQMCKSIKEPVLVWSIQKVIPEGAIFKLGPNGYMKLKDACFLEEKL